MKKMHELNIDFMRYRWWAVGFSGISMLLAIGALVVNGLNLGLDFTGGTQIEVAYNEPADLEQVRSVLEEQGLRDAAAVHFGSNTEVLIRFQGSLEDTVISELNERLAALADGSEVPTVSVERTSGAYQTRITIAGADLTEASDDLFPPDVFGRVRADRQRDATVFQLNETLTTIASAALTNALTQAAGSPVRLIRNEFVGSQVGADMFDDAVLGMLAALLMVMIYVGIRFQYKFALASVAALFHDMLFVVGWFALFQLEFDLTVFASVLAVIGYSINDTIVIADRIRENLRTMRRKSPFEAINIALNQTLGRTIVTGIATLLVLLALFFMGGEVIHNFSLALILGLLVGTYSSVYVAATVLFSMNITQKDLQVPVKEGAELDSLP